MSYASEVLQHYAAAPEAERKALAAALAAAGKAMPAPKPGAGGKDKGEKHGAHDGAVMSEAATYANTRPDVMLAKAADEIALAEGVDAGTALRLAQERDPMLRMRYNGREDARKLAERVKVEPPRGMRLCECPPDVEIAERAQAIAAAENLSYAEAERRLLADNPKLKSRYHDATMGECALSELAYRVDTIRTAGAGRVTQRKAVDAALAEDPTLRESVFAYFEREPYKSTSNVEA